MNIAIADDHQLFREGIRYLLRQMKDVSEIFEAHSHSELFTLLGSKKVDILLLDLNMPEMDGIEAFKKITYEFPALKIIILTMYNDIKLMNYLMQLGADSYLVKDTSFGELQEAIETVYKHGLYVHPKLGKALIEGVKLRSPKKLNISATESISTREKEILEMICEGLTAKEIAEKLFISQRTAEGHRERLLQKFAVKNTPSLIVKAIKEKIIEV
ncbi:MAG: response regulator [Salibacteraceae bacterium]